LALEALLVALLPMEAMAVILFFRLQLQLAAAVEPVQMRLVLLAVQVGAVEQILELEAQPLHLDKEMRVEMVALNLEAIVVVVAVVQEPLVQLLHQQLLAMAAMVLHPQLLAHQ
jgi:hypothetical protein